MKIRKTLSLLCGVFFGVSTPFYTGDARDLIGDTKMMTAKDTELSPQKRKDLIQAAENALKNAYEPYSKFKVGAAVLTEKNNIYTGCNVENASYGLTICAERNAIFSAVAHEGPAMRIKAMAISTLPAVALGSSCGACRQVIAEFAS